MNKVRARTLVVKDRLRKKPYYAVLANSNYQTESDQF